MRQDRDANGNQSRNSSSGSVALDGTGTIGMMSGSKSSYFTVAIVNYPSLDLEWGRGVHYLAKSVCLTATYHLLKS